MAGDTSTDAPGPVPAAAAAGSFLQGLERGLAVIRAFSAELPSLTLSEVARDVGITPATARRILLTLGELGYVRTDGRRFSLTPRVLALGWAYLSSLDLGDIAGPFMEELSLKTRESCSIATLDLPDIVYVARVPTSRIMTVALGVGARLPAYATSMGRVLLAGLPEDELAAYLSSLEAEALTEHTVTSADALREVIDAGGCRRLCAGRSGAGAGTAVDRRTDPRFPGPCGRRAERLGARLSLHPRLAAFRSTGAAARLRRPHQYCAAEARADLSAQALSLARISR